MTLLGEKITAAGYETHREFAEECGISTVTLSILAQKKLLPTMPILARMCKLLNVKPLNLYCRDEIDLVNVFKRVSKHRRRIRFRIEANLGRENYNGLKRVLAKKGYTIQDWIVEQVVKELDRAREVIEL